MHAGTLAMFTSRAATRHDISMHAPQQRGKTEMTRGVSPKRIGAEAGARAAYFSAQLTKDGECLGLRESGRLGCMLAQSETALSAPGRVTHCISISIEFIKLLFRTLEYGMRDKAREPRLCNYARLGRK
jgi:hypothetical protein